MSLRVSDDIRMTTIITGSCVLKKVKLIEFEL